MENISINIELMLHNPIVVFHRSSMRKYDVICFRTLLCECERTSGLVEDFDTKCLALIAFVSFTHCIPRTMTTVVVTAKNENCHFIVCGFK